MLAGTFQSNLRKLNRNLRIFCGNDDTKPAGIFRVIRGEYTDIVGVDKDIVPERSIFNENGSHFKGGWRRVLRVLIGQGLIDRKEAEKVFQTQLPYRGPKKTTRKKSLRPSGLNLSNRGY